jgi:hypothetical protein
LSTFQVSHTIVSGQWAESLAIIKLQLNPKVKYDDELKEQFGNAYVYLEQLFKNDVSE